MRPRLSRALLALALAIPLSVLGAASPAGACTCDGPAWTLDEADAVFIGQVARSHPPREDGDVAVKIVEVSDVFKGDVNRLQGIALPAGPDACADTLDTAGIYVVFATRSGALSLEDGFYETDSCSGTRLLTDSAELDIDVAPYAPSDNDAPSTDDIRAQLGDPRSSLFPEMFILAGVLAAVLGTAAWFSRKSRPAI